MATPRPATRIRPPGTCGLAIATARQTMAAHRARTGIRRAQRAVQPRRPPNPPSVGQLTRRRRLSQSQGSGARSSRHNQDGSANRIGPHPFRYTNSFT